MQEKTYCIHCKIKYSYLIVAFDHYSWLEGVVFGICYNCIDSYEGARED